MSPPVGHHYRRTRAVILQTDGTKPGNITVPATITHEFWNTYDVVYCVAQALYDVMLGTGGTFPGDGARRDHRVLSAVLVAQERWLQLAACSSQHKPCRVCLAADPASPAGRSRLCCVWLRLHWCRARMALGC